MADDTNISEKVKGIFTNYGKNQIAQALAGGYQIIIGEMVYGDGAGSQYEPLVTQTALRNQLGSTTAIAKIEDDVWTFFEGIIPASAPDGVIREIGITDSTGQLMIIVVVPDVHKVTSVNGVQQRIPIRIGVTTAQGSVMTVITDPDSVPPFTQFNLGLIRGRKQDGYVAAIDGDTGYGHVTGWENVVKRETIDLEPQDLDTILRLSDKSKIQVTDKVFGHHDVLSSDYDDTNMLIVTIGSTDTHLNFVTDKNSETYGDHITVDTPEGVKHLEYVEDTEDRITNYITTQLERPTHTNTSINIPELTVMRPIGRTVDNKLLSEEVKISANTFNITNLPSSAEITYDTEGTYVVFYNVETNQPQICGKYTRFTDIEPEDPNIGDVWYTFDNIFKTPGTVSANYTTIGNTRVTKNGTISNLGALQFLKVNPIQDQPEFKFSFTTGSDIITTQDIFSLPYSIGTISNNNLNIYGYSYAYGISYNSDVYSGTYLLDREITTTSINLSSLDLTVYCSGLPVVGSYVYEDYELTQIYGYITDLPEAGGIRIKADTEVYAGSYRKIVDNFYVYTLGSTEYYTSEEIALNTTVYLNTQLTEVYGTVTSFDPDGNIIKVTKFTYSGNYALVSQSGNLYTYDLNDTSYYTSEELAENVVLYIDTNLSIPYGYVSNINGANVTIRTIQYSGVFVKVVKNYFTYLLGTTNYFSQEELQTGTKLYKDTSFTDLFGFVSSITLQQVSVRNTILKYEGAFSSGSTTVYKYQRSGGYFYSTVIAAANIQVFTDPQLLDVYGIVESITDTNIVIHSITSQNGYVASTGTGRVPKNLIIYSNADLTDQVTVSTGLNARYIGSTILSKVGPAKISILPNTLYDCTLTFVQSDVASRLILTANYTSEAIQYNKRQLYIDTFGVCILGGTNNFNGTMDLSKTLITNSWSWNGETSNRADWVEVPLCELGTLVLSED